MPLNPLDHSLHDAYVESVVVGPRREVLLHLELGSARISDPRLPDSAVLRFGAITNLDDIREVMDLGPEPNCRIDQVVYETSSIGAVHCVRLELDPQGVVEVQCDKVSLTPSDEPA